MFPDGGSTPPASTNQALHFQADRNFLSAFFCDTQADSDDGHADIPFGTLRLGYIELIALYLFVEITSFDTDGLSCL